MTPYTSVEEVRRHLGDTTSELDGTALQAKIQAVTNAINAYCGGRRFWLDPAVTTRVYLPHHWQVASIDDVGSLTGLVVKTDTVGDGTWATTIAATDYQMEPFNAATDGGAYAWSRLRLLNGRLFPTSRWGNPTLQVTALHGWSQIPDGVREAALLKTASLFKRRESPDGFARGMADFGPVRISRFEDPDVVTLLSEFRRGVVA